MYKNNRENKGNSKGEERQQPRPVVLATIGTTTVRVITPKSMRLLSEGIEITIGINEEPLAGILWEIPIEPTIPTVTCRFAVGNTEPTEVAYTFRVQPKGEPELEAKAEASYALQ